MKATLYVFLGLMAGQWGVAAPQPMAETATATASPIRTDSRAQADMISTMGMSSLLYVAEARQAIHDKDYQKASGDLSQAQSLFQMIEHNLPLVRIKDEIGIAKSHLTYEQTALVEPDLIPIYREISVIRDEPSRSRFRAGLDRVKHFLRIGKKDQANQELTRLDQAIVYSQVNLPVRETQSLVTSAQDKLGKKDYAGADAALAGAEGNLRLNVAALIGPEPGPVPAAEQKKAE